MSLSSLNLEAFSVCAQMGNFTRAAEKLHITQSALSQRILNLERELETAVFIRDRSGLRLTEAGQDLLRYCHAKESLEAEVLGRVRSASARELRGPIRIGGFSSVMRSVILPALAPLLAEHPNLKLNFFVVEMAELLPMLKRGEIDYMVLDHEIRREDIKTQILGREHYVLVEKKGYKGPDIYLDHDEEDPTTLSYLRMLQRPERVQRRYLDDVYGLIDGVRLGLGRAVLPLHLIRKDRTLQTLEPARVYKVPVVLHYYSQAYYTRLHESVIEALSQNSPPLLGGRN